MGCRGGRDMNRNRGVRTVVYREQKMFKSLRAEEEHVKSKVTPVYTDLLLPCSDSLGNKIP